MYGAFFGYEPSIREVDYDNLSPENVNYLTNRAINRDNKLTPEEQEVRDETERVCILGPNYWLRAHP